MGLATLKTLYVRASQQDYENLSVIYENQGKTLDQVIDMLTTTRSEQQLREQFFRTKRDGDTKSNNHTMRMFMLKGGYVHVIARRKLTLEWILDKL